MSLDRLFSPEFRSMFRTFEEPYGRPSYSHYQNPSFNSERLTRNISPAVDVTENPDSYIVHAEIPGVKKENVQVSVGDAGRSVTIKGRVVVREGGESAPANNNANTGTPTTGSTNNSRGTSKEVDRGHLASGNRLHSERVFIADSSFARTIQLPYPVDPAKVKAKMLDGVLEINLGKLDDKSTTKTIAID